MGKEEFEGWEKLVDSAYLLWRHDGENYERPSYMTRTEKDMPQYTPDEEYDMMAQQVDKSDGFDIDFSLFRCVFNYHPAELDSHQFVDEPETTRDLLEMLSKGSLDGYNQRNTTKFEFHEVVRANYHFAGAIMFLITFQVKDPYDDLIKNFQARVLHAKGIRLEYIFCRPEPHQKVECVGIAKKDLETTVDAKRQLLQTSIDEGL